MSSVETSAEQLREQGFCVLPAHYDAGRVARLRRAILELYERMGRPSLYAKKPIDVRDGVELSSTGLVIKGLLGHCEALAGDMLDEQVVRIVQRALGEDAIIELTAGVLSDRSRPFFEWHDHLGGVDEELFRRRGERPRLPILQRIAMIVYLDEIGPGAGELLVHPKRNPDGSPPVGAPKNEPWPGQVVVGGPPGTTVLVDQTTWHAATPRTRDGLRIFFGGWFASSAAREAERTDPSLSALRDAPPLFRELLPHLRGAR